MKGKILGSGVISGDDNRRYYYDEGELKNAREGQNIEGLEVDFELVDGKAVGVFIINKPGFSGNFSSFNVALENLPKIDNRFIFLNLNEVKGFILNPNVHSIKVFVLLTLVCYLLFFVSLGSYFENAVRNTSNASFYIFGILTFFSGLWVNLSLLKLSSDRSLLKYFMISTIAIIITYTLYDSIINHFTAASFAFFFGERTGKPYFKIILAFVFLLAFLYVNFLWYRKISELTNERLFLWGFYAQVLSQICLVGYIIVLFNTGRTRVESLWYDFSMILGVLSTALIAFIWLKFRELRVKS